MSIPDALSLSNDIAAEYGALFGTLDEVKVVLDYEPDELQNSPAVVTFLQRVDFDYPSGSMTTVMYTHTHRLLIALQNPKEAERSMRIITDKMAMVIEANARLATAGVQLARLTAGATGYYRIAGVIYRGNDLESVTKLRRARYTG